MTDTNTNIGVGMDRTHEIEGMTPTFHVEHDGTRTYEEDVQPSGLSDGGAGIVVGILPLEAWDLVLPTIWANGGYAPNPLTSKIVAAVEVETGTVVGYIVVQLVAHAEPLYINPAFQDQGVWRELARCVDEMFQGDALEGVKGGGYYVFTPVDDPVTQAMAEHWGMEKKPWMVWEKNFMTPDKEGG